MSFELAPAHISQDQRDKYKSQGVTLPDGSFPIPNVDYLHRAVQSFGRCPPGKRAALVSHIRSSAKRLGASGLDWVKNFLASHSGGKTDMSLEMAGTAVETGPGGSMSGMQPIQTVNHLRKAITQFSKTRPNDRKKLAGHIRDRATALNAEDLPWVDSFLKQHGLDSDEGESPGDADDNPSSDGEPSNTKKFKS